jgi:hypothetical protein
MSTTATPLAGTFAADPVHSSFGFAVRYQGVSLFKGTLSEVDAKLADGRLEGTAKVESISIRTPDQFRQHVLSAEFFDAANHPEVTFTSSDLDLHEVAGVLEGQEFVPAADVPAQLHDPVLQNRLRMGLRHGLGGLMGAVEHGEVDGQPAEVALVADLYLTEPGQQPPLVEDFHGARRETQAPRLTRPFGQAFKDDDVDTRQPQLSGEHHSGWSRSDDDYFGIHMSSSVGRVENSGEFRHMGPELILLANSVSIGKGSR